MADERLVIDHIGHQGDGVAISGSGKEYVPNTLPGETIEIDRQKDRGLCAKIISPSPDRIAPICRYFGVCGGCALQHWKEENYRAWKRGLVVDALAHEEIAAPVGDLIDAHGEGRRRAVLHARRTREGVTVGFTARRSHTVVAIDRCPVLAPALARAFAIGERIAAELATKEKPLDLQFTATEGGLDVDVRGSGPLDAAARSSLARIAAEERLARLTRHGEIVAQLAEPRAADRARPRRAAAGRVFAGDRGGRERACGDRWRSGCGRLENRRFLLRRRHLRASARYERAASLRSTATRRPSARLRARRKRRA